MYKDKQPIHENTFEFEKKNELVMNILLFLSGGDKQDFNKTITVYQKSYSFWYPKEEPLHISEILVWRVLRILYIR